MNKLKIISIAFFFILSFQNAFADESKSLEDELKNCQTDPAKCSLLIAPPIKDVTKTDQPGSGLNSYDDPPKANPNETPSIVTDVSTNIINLIFQIAGLFGIVAAVVAGVMMVIAKENEEMLNTAKRILTYTFIGFILIAVSYALIIGISNIKLGFIDTAYAQYQLGKDPYAIPPSNLPGSEIDSLNAMQRVIFRIISPLLGVATGVSIFFIVLGGFMWITSMGKQEQMDRAKKTMTWSILGFCVILFSYLFIQIITRIFYEEVPTNTSTQTENNSNGT